MYLQYKRVCKINKDTPINNTGYVFVLDVIEYSISQALMQFKIHF